MAFTDTTFARSGAKRVARLAHTKNSNDPANESIASGPVIDAAKFTITQTIDNSQSQAVTDTTIEVVTFDLVQIAGTDAYTANFPTGYNAGGGFFGSVDGNALRDSSFAIPKTFSNPVLDTDSDGYNPVVKNSGGTRISDTDSSDWIWDESAGVITPEDASASGTNWPPTTIKCAIYIGTTIKAHLDNVDKLTTRGDLLTRNATIYSRLALGASGTFLKSDGTDPSWVSIAAIDIADGSVTNSEFQFINTVSSNVQDQIDGKQASDSDLTAISALSTTGLLVRTGSGTYATRQVAPVSGEITVLNGTGVSGNPVVGIANDVVLPGSVSVIIPSGVTGSEPVAVVGMLRYDTTTGKLRGVDGGSWVDIVGGGGGGETNTASNQGVGGIGVFDAKVSVDLQFRNIIAKSSKIVVTLNGGNKEVEIDAVEANIVHQNLSGAGSNTHATIDTHLADTSDPHGASMSVSTKVTTPLIDSAGTINITATGGNGNVDLKAEGTGDIGFVRPGTAFRLIHFLDSLSADRIVDWDNRPLDFGSSGTFAEKTHASTHESGGADTIRDATASQNGLMTDTAMTKLDGIEALADVTDVTNVAAALDTDLTEIAGLANVRGDILYTNATANWARLGKGTANQVLTSDGTDVAWANAAGSSTPEHTEVFYLQDLTATDSFPIMFTSVAITITKIWGIVLGATSVTFNLFARTFADTFDATDQQQIGNASIIATVTGADETDFGSPGSASISAGETIQYIASAISGSPTQLWVAVSYTVD